MDRRRAILVPRATRLISAVSTAVSAGISQDHAQWYHFSRPFEEKTHRDLTALIVGGKGEYFPYLTD